MFNVYEKGLTALQSASPEELKGWIKERSSGTFTTPLDDYATAVHVETTRLIDTLYHETDESGKQKIQDAIDLLLTEVMEQHLWGVISNVVFIIGRCELKFPIPVLVDFMANLTVSGGEEYYQRGDVMALLQGYVKEDPELRQKYTEWFWSEPMVIGEEHALQLFAGLVEANPQDYPRLLVRLLEINHRMSEEKKFQEHWIFFCLFENCSPEILEAGLPHLPEEIRAQLLKFQEENRDLL